MNVTNMIAGIIEDAAKTVAKVRQRALIVEDLQNEGITIPYIEGVVRYGYSVDVNRKDLSKVRKVVGRLTMVGKDTAWDFDKTNELAVRLAPVDTTNFPVTFEYRTKYRKGGKCKLVQRVSPASISTSLVCET